MDPHKIKESLELNDEPEDVKKWRLKFELSFKDPQTIYKNAYRIYDDRYIQRMWLGYLQAKKEDALLIKILRSSLDGFIVWSNAVSVFIRSTIYGKVDNEKLKEEIQGLYNYQCLTEAVIRDAEDLYG